MQHNKERTKRLREGRSESIRMETGDKGKRIALKRKRDFRACKQQATTAEKRLRASL